MATNQEVIAMDNALAAVRAELLLAFSAFSPIRSAHEGKAVIEEELEELWELIKVNAGRSLEARGEAKQIAAMAVRYMVDVAQ